MKIIILGAGAIGSIYGAILSQRYETILIGRQQHVDAINSKGLVVTGLLEKVFSLSAKEEISEVDPDDIVILTSKVPDSVKAISRIKHLLCPANKIICLQNGVGIEEQVKDIVSCRVFRAITNYASYIKEPGVISFHHEGYTKIEKGASVEIFKDLNCKEVADIQKAVWKKTVVNCILNPLTAIHNLPNSCVGNLEIRKDILREIKEVLDQERIIFPESFYQELIGTKFSENISSMLSDVRRSRKTEIDYINGAVVILAEKHGISVPINEMLVREIKGIESAYPK